MADISIWTWYSGLRQPKWKLCTFRESILENKNLMNCDKDVIPLINVFKMEAGSPGGLSIQDIRIYGIGRFRCLLTVNFSSLQWQRFTSQLFFIFTEYSPLCHLNGRASMSSSVNRTTAYMAVDSIDRDFGALFQPVHDGSTYSATENLAYQWWSIDLGWLYNIDFISFLMHVGE